MLILKLFSLFPLKVKINQLLYILQVTSEPSTPSHDQNSSYLELLAENANLQKKITLLESKSQTSEASANSNTNPWKQELEKSQIMIQDLTNALEDRLIEVDIIKEKTQLQELNETLAKKLLDKNEELTKASSQLQDAKDQADLLEFRVFELEEEIEKRDKVEAAHNAGQDEKDDQVSTWSDSGCNSSYTTDSDILELHQDYRVSDVLQIAINLPKQKCFDKSELSLFSLQESAI